MIKHLKAKDIRVARPSSLSQIPVLMDLVERVAYPNPFSKAPRLVVPPKERRWKLTVRHYLEKPSRLRICRQQSKGLVKAKAIAFGENGAVNYLS